MVTLSHRAHKLPLGIYEHYKGNRYEVIGVGHHTETLQELVFYRALHGDHGFWVRPLEMFLENVTLPDGQVVERFKLISGKVRTDKCC